jgi:protein polybromo-1
MRIKKQTLSSSSSASSHHKEQDPVAKVLKIKKPPVLKKKLMAIYRSVVTKMDDDGRFLCELFMKRPSATMYPQYYLVIKNPIDLKEILQKIRSEAYVTMEEMVGDVELMVENACTFNEEDSQVYKVREGGGRKRERW